MWCADKERICKRDETQYEQRSCAGGVSPCRPLLPVSGRGNTVAAVQSGEHNLTSEHADPPPWNSTAVNCSAKEAPPIQSVCSEGIPRAARATVQRPTPRSSRKKGAPRTQSVAVALQSTGSPNR